MNIPDIGLNIVWFRPEFQVRAAVLAEQLGFESAWSGEHVGLPFFPDWWREYPSVTAKGAEGTEKDVLFGPKSKFLDPLITLAAIAGATTRIRLGVGIYMLALRDAILAARMIGSLDVLSNGRLDLAVGLGWSEAEYDFTGNDFRTRGKKMDETIHAIRVCFEMETPEFAGEFHKFGPLGFEPKPIQQPVPILIGGNSGPAERRAARLGNGWHGPLESMPAIKAHLEAEGRADEPFQWSNITFGVLSRQQLEAMKAQGATRIVVTPFAAKVGEVGEEGFSLIEQYARDIGLVPESV